jgi:dienelactone hydrolase
MFCGEIMRIQAIPVLSIAMLLLLPMLAGAEIRTEQIEYRHGDAVLHGFVAWDDAADGPRPGVLVVHEWWGLDDYTRDRTRQLAELGYVAFAIDMYGEGLTTEDPQEAGRLAGRFHGDRRLGRDRAAAGLAMLAAHPLVDPQRIAAIGYCFGGTVALELARDGADIAGAVSFHGSLGTPMPATADTLRARILVLHGADDPLVPIEDINRFRQEMTDAEADWQFISYGGAVHSFTNPRADDRGIPGVAYNETADRRSWQHMKLFFEELFAEDRP